jgi:hypothetical protein
MNKDGRLQISSVDVTRESIQSWSEAVSGYLYQIKEVTDQAVHAPSSQLSAVERERLLSRLEHFAGGIAAGLLFPIQGPLPRATGPETPGTTTTTKGIRPTR